MEITKLVDTQHIDVRLDSLSDGQTFESGGLLFVRLYSSSEGVHVQLLQGPVHKEGLPPNHLVPWHTVRVAKLRAVTYSVMAFPSEAPDTCEGSSHTNPPGVDAVELSSRGFESLIGFDVAMSSSVGDYPDAMGRPGTSALWINGNLYNREAVRKLVDIAAADSHHRPDFRGCLKNLQSWVETGSLIPTETYEKQKESE